MRVKGKNRGFRIALVVWLVLLSGALSSIATMMLMGNPGYALPPGNELPDRYKRLSQIRQIVMDSYYQEADDAALLDGAAHGMLYALEDPYTFYYNAEEMKAMTEHSGGQYYGVGIQVVVDPHDSLITVTRVFEGGPAGEAGLLSGDKIVAVEGVPVTGYELDYTINTLKSKRKEPVNVSIKRGESVLSFDLLRAQVVINRIEYEMLEEGIGYIVIYEFMGDDVNGFENALTSLKSQGMRALVLDVRQNPGGMLDHVVAIADILIPEGLIVYTKNRQGRQMELNSSGEGLGLPMALLVDGMSASASEVLAGALQDYGTAVIVGQTTFGKGIVQTVIPFDDGAGMQLTTSAFYTPKGRSIHKTGITPDVEVAQPEREDIVTPLSRAEDAQLQKAIEIVAGMID